MVANVDPSSDFNLFLEHFRHKYPDAVAKKCIEKGNYKLLEVLSGFSNLSEKYRISLSDSDDVKKRAEEILASSDREIVNVVVDSVVNYKRLFSLGFCPHPDSRIIPGMVVYYLEGRLRADMKFWFGEDEDYFSSFHVWSVFKLSFLEPYRARAYSYPFLVSYPDQLYKSMRPKTNMDLFRLPGTITYNSSLHSLIPVTRYAKSMSGSMYFGQDRPHGVCGRFYYYEPESQVNLVYRKGRVLKGFNKVDVYHKIYDDVQNLDPQLAYNLQQRYLEVISDKKGKQVELHRNGTLRRDLLYTSREAYTFLNLNSQTGTQAVPKEGGQPGYVGKLLEMYAAEDELDQPLCKAAFLLGYDIVLLENMVGSHQVVTEVLDTREDSFKYLKY
jgi:hypothetical protein